MKAAVLLTIALWLTIVVGWCMNVFQLIQMYGGDGVTTKFVFKIIGVFLFPLGSLLGFIN